jgi:hypothetical protein
MRALAILPQPSLLLLCVLFTKLPVQLLPPTADASYVEPVTRAYVLQDQLQVGALHSMRSIRRRCQLAALALHDNCIAMSCHNVVRHSVRAARQAMQQHSFDPAACRELCFAVGCRCAARAALTDAAQHHGKLQRFECLRSRKVNLRAVSQCKKELLP